MLWIKLLQGYATFDIFSFTIKFGIIQFWTIANMFDSLLVLVRSSIVRSFFPFHVSSLWIVKINFLFFVDDLTRFLTRAHLNLTNQNAGFSFWQISSRIYKLANTTSKSKIKGYLGCQTTNNQANIKMNHCTSFY